MKKNERKRRKEWESSGDSKKKFTNPFRFTSLFKPMVYLLLFSLAYSAGWLYWTSHAPETLNPCLVSLPGCLMLSVYGLCLYFVCTLVWGKKRGTLSAKKALSVWIVCLLVALVCMYGLTPLSYAGGNAALLILGAFCGLAFLFLVIPCLLFWFYAVYLGIEGFRDQFAFVERCWKTGGMKALNLWLIVFLLIWLWDSLMGGPLYSGSGFDAPGICTSLFFMGEPGTYFVLLLMLGHGFNGDLLMLTAMQSLFLVFYACNTISWIGQICQKTLEQPEGAERHES